MAMSYEEWAAANPAPYDLKAFVDAGNQQFANIQYDQRPQEWLDEYQRMKDANMRWQASYNTQTGAAPTNEASLTNPYLPVWNGAARQYMTREAADAYGQGPNADPTIVPGGTPTGTQLAQNPVTGNYGGTTPTAPGGAAVPFTGGGGTNYAATYGSSDDPFSGFRVPPADPNYALTDPAQITPGGIAEMMNPYLQQVRDTTLTDIERSRQLAQMTTDDQANAAKAFGGSRHGVSNALTNDAYAREAGRQSAALNAQGFNTAAGLAGQNAGLAQQAGLSNAANYMAGRGQDIAQNAAFMSGGLQQRGQDMGYNLGMSGQQLNAYSVANSLMNSSGLMDWLSVNQGANAVNGSNNQSTTTQPGSNWWNDALGGLFTGWALTRG